MCVKHVRLEEREASGPVWEVHVIQDAWTRGPCREYPELGRDWRYQSSGRRRAEGPLSGPCSPAVHAATSHPIPWGFGPHCVGSRTSSSPPLAAPADKHTSPYCSWVGAYYDYF